MAKVKVIGIDSFIDSINTTSRGTKEVCGRAVFDGASIVADTIKAEIRSLPERAEHDGYASGVKAVERVGLENSFGISRMIDSSGFMNVKLGFDGYNAAGKPNAMIARSIESGTSWLRKTPFISSAVRKAQAKAEAKMKATFEQEISKRSES